MLNILSRIIRRFYRKFSYYETSFKNDYVESEYIKKIDGDIVEEIKKQYPQEFTDRKYNIFKNRYSNKNDNGYVLSIKGEIVSYGWIGKNNFYEGTSGYSSKLPRDTVYLYDLYTFEKFRKKGYMEILVESLFYIYKKEKYKYIRTIVSFDNKKSNGLMSKFDFKAVGLISVKYFKGKRYIKFKDLTSD
ncbi:MAG: GNAT family N-acetyltransferase [Tissierella sp.]|uniref:GNAT family N-acetyltransferase n=1 Tax=Tissierella sp. TaxID=41274 RepID=UPI003F983048